MRDDLLSLQKVIFSQNKPKIQFVLAVFCDW
jgi:hypothetical protein